jgi:uncharacterized membrane protein YfcA
MTFSVFQTVAIALVSFVAGIIVGVLLRPFLLRQEKITISIKHVIALVLLTLLTFSVLAEIFGTYKTSPFLYGLVGTVVGSIYGPDILSSKKDKKK